MERLKGAARLILFPTLYYILGVLIIALMIDPEDQPEYLVLLTVGAFIYAALHVWKEKSHAKS